MAFLKSFNDLNSLIFFFKILALCPMDENWNISIPWLLYSVLYLITYNFLVMSFYFIYYFSYFNNHLMKVVSLTVCLSNCLSVTFTFYFFISKRNYIRLVFREVDSISVHLNRNACIGKSFLVFLLGDIVIFLFCVFFEWTVVELNIRIALVYWMFVYLNLSMKQFTAILQPLRILSASLTPMIKEESNVKDIIELCRIYNRLVDCCAEVNAAFSLPIFVYFSSAFLHLINTLFCFRLFISTCISDSRCYISAWCLFWAVSLFLNLISVIYESTSTSDKAGINSVYLTL